ncbi:hypothetical protein CRE_23018 [Caenorhabditis remanei]|uniref:Uncharacterized protein n=1 Tax=Caenorhabditis remanei TaxID=31234 RepID=E3N4D7_CAERE|nr:hypothetical protein CRE_23018 [Caenorhabditis remanei]
MTYIDIKCTLATGYPPPSPEGSIGDLQVEDHDQNGWLDFFFWKDLKFCICRIRRTPD